MKKTLALLAALGVASPAFASPEATADKMTTETNEVVEKAAGSADDAVKAAEAAKEMAKKAAKEAPAAGGNMKNTFKDASK